MQLIKDQQIIEDSRQFITDDQPIPAQGEISVSLQRWLAERDQLLSFPSKVGVRLSPTDATADLTQDLDKIALVEVEFPVYTDGRAFSHARLLRSRYHYQGEIRAVGQFMADQVFYLSRVGVNAFQLPNPSELPVALNTLQDFTVNYQLSTE